ncbi:MAG: Smr/MutS family protein [Acidobacteriota bacterium]|jgi:dsDNA-specific endonuclease/ATPase MutS2
MDRDGPVEIPINGTLDLHTFRPGDVKDIVPEYLRLCREQGILEVRIIHGKGTGTLLRTVHSILSRLSWVRRYELADQWAGSWGATIVWLEEDSG